MCLFNHCHQCETIQRHGLMKWYHNGDSSYSSYTAREKCMYLHCLIYIGFCCGWVATTFIQMVWGSFTITNRVTSWWAGWRLKSPASRLIAQPFVQAEIKETINTPRNSENDDVIITVVKIRLALKEPLTFMGKLISRMTMPSLYRYIKTKPNKLISTRWDILQETYHKKTKCTVCDWRFLHDDVIKWNHFTRYWPFVRGIHRSPVESPHKDQRRGAVKLSLIFT